MTPDALAPLRLTAVLCGWCGVAALMIARLLPTGVGFAVGFTVAVLSAWCSMYRSDAARALRRQLSFVVLAAALGYVALQIGGSRNASQLAETLPALLIGVLAAQGLGADKRHDVMVSVTVGEFMIVLAAGVAPTPWLAAPLVAGWLLAIVALAQSHDLHSSDCTAAAPRAVAHPPAGRRSLGPTVAAAVLALAVGVLFFLLIPQPSSGVAQRQLRNQLGSSDLGRGGTAGSRLADGPIDMRNRGDLGNRPVADVPADSPQLWRQRIYDSFDGVIWTAPQSRVVPISRGRGRVLLPPDPLDEGAPPGDSTRTDYVRTAPGYESLIIAPGTPVAITGDGAVVTQGAAGLFRFGGAANFLVQSAAAQPDAGVLAEAEETDPGERWLQLPANLPSRVRALAVQLAGEAPNRPAAVQAITDYLQANKTYDLKSPVPPPGADAVDHFLFDSDTGFCEQFAAAEVVLLRTLGIPARMAAGYAYGKSKPDGRREFTSANAHAWVEIWYPDRGWAAADPTPASSQAADTKQGLWQRLVLWVQRTLSTTRGRLTLALGIVLISAAIFAFVWWRRRRPLGQDPVAPDQLANALVTAFGRLEAALAADGRPRASGETLTELDRRLGTGADGRRALATLELAVYSPHLVSPEAARAAAQAFEQLAASILAAHAARAELADSIGVRR